MKILMGITLCSLLYSGLAISSEIVPFNEDNWDIQAKAFVLENYQGKDAIYLQRGSATLKEFEFLNGTIEFDVYLTERQSFPGVYFRQFDEHNEESFFLRPHQSGKPDANQAAPAINGLVAWQLYFGERYSFAYEYNFNGWTHIRLVVKDDRAQVFLDHAEEANLSWVLKHRPQKGKVSVGGSFAPMHYADFTISPDLGEIIPFQPMPYDSLPGVVQDWEISDQFSEEQLNNPNALETLIQDRSWDHSISIEENNAANISWVASIDDTDGKTVFARLKFDSKSDHIKQFDFGYSDRVVAILNGKAIYRGNNKWRSRDYRYLGTIGFFDSIYLDLKKGENTLLFAVSEDFGGWGISGKFADSENIEINP
jgi:hypothetical protein